MGGFTRAMKLAFFHRKSLVRSACGFDWRNWLWQERDSPEGIRSKHWLYVCVYTGIYRGIRTI